MIHFFSTDSKLSVFNSRPSQILRGPSLFMALFFSFVLVNFSIAAAKKPMEQFAKGPTELIQNAIDCLNRGDTAKFYQLSIVRDEYKNLYPFLPRADTTNNEDRDFRMGFFLMDNRKMILRIFEKHGKHNLKFSRMAFLGEKEDRNKFAFHHGLHVWVLENGIEVELPLSKSLISLPKGWKFWGFSGD